MSNPHAINIATKGILSKTANSLALKGYLPDGILEEVVEIIGGGGRAPEEAWDAYKHLKEKKKKKVIKVIMWLKGEKFEEEHAIEDYEVTVDDINLILEEHKKRVKQKIEIQVSNISVD